MAITTLTRQLQISGSKTFDDSKTTGHAMLVSGSLRTLQDDLNNIRTTVKQVTGEGSWADPLSTVGSAQRNFKQQRTYLDGLVSGSNKFQAVTVHLNAGDFDVSDPDGAGNAISLDAGAASNFTVDSANLTLSTTTSGDVVVSAGGGAVDIDADGGTLSLDGSTGINIGTEADVAVDMDTSTLDIDASDAITIDSTSGISLDAGATSNFTATTGNLILSGATTSSLGGGAISFYVDGVVNEGAVDGLLLSSGSSDVSTFLSNFSEGQESILSAINTIYNLASGGSISKSVSRITASLSANTNLDGISVDSTKWTNDDVNVYVNGVLQASGSVGQYDVYRQGDTDNLRFNFDLVTGDVVIVQSF